MPHILPRIFLPCLWLGLCMVSPASAAERAKVVLFAVPETIWQAKLEGQFRDHTDLWTRLEERVREREAERPVHVLCELKSDAPFAWKHGETRKFTTGWQVIGGKPGVKPERFADQFVGTTLSIENTGVQPDGTVGLELALEHHITPPSMRPLNFAQAAEGAERDRLSVEYPNFSKLEWRGKVSLGHACRLVAQVLQAPGNRESKDPAQRYLLFIIPVIP
ncbi:MAG: hypothetical protein ACO1TE_14300 [Prosthecobacter sp.]